jgi:hypothetical protein
MSTKAKWKPLQRANMVKQLTVEDIREAMQITGELLSLTTTRKIRPATRITRSGNRGVIRPMVGPL